MARLLATLVLLCCATLCDAAPSRVRLCSAWDAAPPGLALDEHGGALKQEHCYRYTDASGSYRLYLLSSKDRPFGWFGWDTMSTRVVAQLFRRDGRDEPWLPQWTVRDRSEPGEAGAWFATKYVQFVDLDDHETLTPIVAIRFWTFDPKDPHEPAFDARAGRMNFYLFHGRTPVVIHATTGRSERDRSIVATPSFFDLPAPHQRHLVEKMKAIYLDDVFGFDDAHQFVPRREPPR